MNEPNDALRIKNRLQERIQQGESFQEFWQQFSTETTELEPDRQADCVWQCAVWLADMGRERDSINLFEHWFCLQNAWHDLSRVHNQLAQRFAEVSSQAAANIVYELWSRFSNQQRHSDALTLLECWLDLHGKWAQSDAVKTQLNSRFAGVDAQLAAAIVGNLAINLGKEERHSDALTLLACWLDLQGKWYQVDAVRAQMDRRLAGVDAESADLIVCYLAALLKEQERDSNALTLLECWFDLHGKWDQVDAVKAQLHRRLAGMDALFAAEIVGELAKSLNIQERHCDVLTLLECWLDLYGKWDQVDAVKTQLKSRLAGVDAQLAAEIVRSLASSLIGQQRHSASLTLLECWFDLYGRWNDKDALLVKLEEKLAPVDFDWAGALIANFSTALYVARRYQHVLTLIETWLPLDQRQTIEQLGEKLDELTDRITRQNAFEIILGIIASYSHLSRFDAAKKTVIAKFGESVTEEFWWTSNVNEEGCEISRLAWIAYYWSQSFGDDPKRFFQVTDRMSWAFEEISDETDNTDDCESFLVLCDSYISSSTIAADSKIHGFEKHAPLFFRERIANSFMRQRLSKVSAVEPDQKSILFDEVKTDAEYKRSCFSSLGSLPSVQKAEPANLLLNRVAFPVDSSATTRPIESFRIENDRSLRTFGFELPKLIEERDFAELFRPDEILLHLHVMRGNQIRWQAVNMDTASLEIKHICLADSREAAFKRLLEYEMAFHFALDRAYAMRSTFLNQYSRPSSVDRGTLAQIAEFLDAPEPSRLTSANAEGLLGYPSFQNVFSIIQADVQQAGGIAPSHEWLVEALRKELNFIQSQHAKNNVGGARHEHDNVLVALETNLDRWVNSIARELSFRSLGDAPEIPWNKSHVVMQADGALHSLPLDMLPFDREGRPLIECIDGFSQVISVPLRDAIENQAPISRPGKPRILSAYHLPDRQWQLVRGFDDFHQKVTNELGKQGWEVDGLANANELKASVKNVRTLLNSHEMNYRLAVIGGHGNGLKHGITMLNQEMLTGEGLDLRSLEGLVAISCSMGQMESVKPGDIEGFFVNLANHGLRRLVAARWPVPEHLACQFAREIVVRWAGLVTDDQPSNGRYEKAVHEIKMRWLNDYRRDPVRNAGKRFTAMAFTHFGSR